VPAPGLYWADAGSIGPVQARHWHITACLWVYSTFCIIWSFWGVKHYWSRLVFHSTNWDRRLVIIPLINTELSNTACHYHSGLVCLRAYPINIKYGPVLGQYWHIMACLRSYISFTRKCRFLNCVNIFNDIGKRPRGCTQYVQSWQDKMLSSLNTKKQRASI